MANEPEEKENAEDGVASRLSGAAQFVIGEIETIGGILTADPITQAEGEYNVETGTVREELEEELEKGDEN